MLCKDLKADWNFSKMLWVVLSNIKVKSWVETTFDKNGSPEMENSHL